MRLLIVGTSGAGKSTLARELSELLDIPHVELDELFWMPAWTARDPDAFRDLVSKATERESWIVDGNYSVVRSVLWPRATTVLWLNYGRLTVFSRIIRRTVWRVATRETLWAGNQESFFKAFCSPKSILLWSFTTFNKNRANFAALRADPRYSHLRWHELRSPAQASAILRTRWRDV